MRLIHAMAETCQICAGEMADGGFCPRCLWSAGMRTDDAGMESAGGHVILEEIGRGGMAVVYRALQPGSGREVALKVMHAAARPELAIRFRQEIGVLESMDHPGILPLYDSGEYLGRPWYSMRLAEEGTLADHLESYRGDFRRIASLVADLARTLHHAHGHGVLHRDIKPANILFVRGGQPCIADFGLARYLDAAGGLTHTADMLGSPDYLSPEAAASRPATVRTDVWGLGAILHTLLSGQPPHTGPDLASVIRAASAAETPAPSAVLTDGWPRPPADLERICRRAMALEPERRYSGADTLAEDLKAWRDGRPIMARRVFWPERVWLWARRHPAMAAAILLLTAAVAGAAWTRWESRQRIAASLGESRRLLNWITSDLADRLEPLGQLAILEETDQRAAEYFARIPEADHTPEFLLIRSEFLSRRANLLTALGRPREAVESASLALADARSAGGPAAGLAAARALRIQATAIRLTGDAPRALLACEEARRQLSGADREIAAETAEISAEAGDCLVSSGRYAEALAEFDAALSGFQALDDGSANVRRRLWQIHFSRAGQLLNLGRNADALLAVSQARGILSELAGAAPAQYRLAGELGTVLNLEGNVQSRLGRRAEASSAWLEQRRYLAVAAAADSRNPIWLHEQAMNAWALATLAEGAAADAEIQAAEEKFEQLNAAAPDQSAWLRSRVEFLRYTAEHWHRRGDSDRLTNAVDTGVKEAGRLAAAMPQDPDAAVWLEEFEEKQGGLLVKSGQPEKALDRCRELLEAVDTQSLAARLCGALGAQRTAEWHLTRGESSLAAPYAARCLEWRMAVLAAHPGRMDLHMRAAQAAKLTAECAGPAAADAVRQHFLSGQQAGSLLPVWLRAAAHLCRSTNDTALRCGIAAAALERLLPPGVTAGEEGARYAAELQAHAAP